MSSSGDGRSRHQFEFVDEVVSGEFRFSVGRETRSGRYFLAVSTVGTNRAVEYEEHFEIDAAEFDRFRADPASARDFLKLCRNGGAQDRRFKNRPFKK